MTPSQAAHFLVYSLISLYASRVVYLIGERIWVALRRWYELKQIWNVFESDMDRGFIAEHNAIQKVGMFDRQQLIDATLAEMFPKRNVDASQHATDVDDDPQADADYSALTLEEATSQEAA